MIRNLPVRPDRDYQLETNGSGLLTVKGVLDITTVTRIHREFQERFHDAVSMPQAIDLSGVTSADSSGLALLIEWIRLGKKQEHEIKFQNIPAQMLPLARLFGVDHLLH